MFLSRKKKSNNKNKLQTNKHRRGAFLDDEDDEEEKKSYNGLERSDDYKDENYVGLNDTHVKSSSSPFFNRNNNDNYINEDEARVFKKAMRESEKSE